VDVIYSGFWWGMVLSESEIENIMSLWIEAGKTFDVDSLINLVSDDATFIGASGRKHNKDEVEEFMSRIKSIWPDRKMIINRWVSQGNTIWAQDDARE
jgi:hypothetical protein